jgi:hypothetical protein
VVIACIAFRTKKISTRPSTETNLNLYQYQKDSNNLTKWIDQLEEYECRDCPIDYKKIDWNGLLSYGCLQYQMGTFQEQMFKYYGIKKGMETVDWENLIYDCDLQKKLTYKMLKNNWSNWKHWKYSIVVRGLETPPKDLIDQR